MLGKDRYKRERAAKAESGISNLLLASPAVASAPNKFVRGSFSLAKKIGVYIDCPNTGSNVSIINNTFYNGDYGIRFDHLSQGFANINNNIFVNLNGGIGSNRRLPLYVEMQIAMDRLILLMLMVTA